MYEKLNGLFSKNDLQSLGSANILLVGIGGVGSPCFECLIRSGIKNITIIDNDIYEESNLNRQLFSNIDTIGKEKTEILKAIALKINPDIKVTAIKEMINENSNLDFTKYDYIIDACDDVKAKGYLIMNADKYNVPIISTFGIGNRLDPSKIVVCLNNEINDHLGKKLNKYLSKNNFNKNFKVVASREAAIKQNPIGSYICVTMSAGIMLANEVIKDVVNENRKHKK